MAISENARFFAEPAPDAEYQHPPGASIARLLQLALADRGWKASEMDNWRDCGWILHCSSPNADLQVVLGKDVEGSEWFLQVSPAYVPGLIGRLLGKKASGSSADILALSKTVQAILSAQPGFTEFRWCWDGDPAINPHTSEPTAG
jgi:hypothetical protein